VIVFYNYAVSQKATPKYRLCIHNNNSNALNALMIRKNDHSVVP